MVEQAPESGPIPRVVGGGGIHHAIFVHLRRRRFVAVDAATMAEVHPKEGGAVAG